MEKIVIRVEKIDSDSIVELNASSVRNVLDIKKSLSNSMKISMSKIKIFRGCRMLRDDEMISNYYQPGKTLKLDAMM